jgi:response regulator RpfG family c-di-GMP phosphodiesterase
MHLSELNPAEEYNTDYPPLTAVPNSETEVTTPETTPISLLNATPEKEKEAQEAVALSHQDRVVSSARALLLERNDHATVDHQDGMAGIGYILIDRVIEVCEDPEVQEQYGITDEQLSSLRNTEFYMNAFGVHDVGKEREDINLLISRDGALDDDEIIIVSQHAEEGALFIKYSDWPASTKEAAMTLTRSHHAYKRENSVGEKVNGELQLGSEIESLADVIEAQASGPHNGRLYKKAFSREEIIAKLKQDFTGQFRDFLIDIAFNYEKFSSKTGQHLGHVAVGPRPETIATAS